MTPKEFEAVWSLLQAAYPRFGNQAAKMVWFDRLERYDQRIAVNAVSEIIDLSERPPSFAAVRTARIAAMPAPQEPLAPLPAGAPIEVVHEIVASIKRNLKAIEARRLSLR